MLCENLNSRVHFEAPPLGRILLQGLHHLNSPYSRFSPSRFQRVATACGTPGVEGFEGSLARGRDASTSDNETEVRKLAVTVYSNALPEATPIVHVHTDADGVETYLTQSLQHCTGSSRTHTGT